MPNKATQFSTAETAGSISSFEDEMSLSWLGCLSSAQLTHPNTSMRLNRLVKDKQSKKLVVKKVRGKLLLPQRPLTVSLYGHRRNRRPRLKTDEIYPELRLCFVLN